VQDDVELYVSERDASVVLRAAARVRKLPDGGRNARRLESIRRRLGWVRAKPRRHLAPLQSRCWFTHLRDLM